jgi:hypothetical protein
LEIALEHGKSGSAKKLARQLGMRDQVATNPAA